MSACSDTPTLPWLGGFEATYPPDKGHIWVVLGRLEQEQDAVKELDATEGCDSHVKEDAEQHSQGDAGQNRLHKDGQSCAEGHSLSSGHQGTSTNRS